MGKTEEWRPVEGYEEFYEVSNFGRVKSVPRPSTKGGILKPSPDIWGYLLVGLYKNGKKETCQVHQLVMQAFVGRCPDGHEVDHINFKQDDNRLENLRYLPATENKRRKSPEWQRKNAEAREKMYKDPEWQRNVSEANKKKAQDPEWQKNHAEGCRKCSQDPEWLKKNAEHREKMYQDPEWRRKNTEVARKKCKPVEQYTLDGVLVKTWSGASEAARELGLSRGNISTCCNGKRKKAGGFIWRYAQ